MVKCFNSAVLQCKKKLKEPKDLTPELPKNRLCKLSGKYN